MDSNQGEWPRRTFLVGATSLPAIQLLGAAQVRAAESDKFAVVDLSRFLNASASAVGTREPARPFSPDRLIRMPSGRRELRGIPFELGPEDVHSKSWLALSTRKVSWAAAEMDVPLRARTPWLCLAQFCEWDPCELNPTSVDEVEKVGQLLAELTLIYQDSSREVLPIRRRYEVNPPTVPWGHRTYMAMGHQQFAPIRLTDALPSGNRWGSLQTTVAVEPGAATLWIWPIQNPKPETQIELLHFRAKSEDFYALCGLTLFHGKSNPLRYGRRNEYRITLPEAKAEDRERWSVKVDLGVVARTHVLPDFDSSAFLANPSGVVGERSAPVTNGRYLYAEISAADDATVTLHDAKTNRDYQFDLAKTANRDEVPARTGPARIEVIERDRAWLRCRAIDTSTGKPTPVRIAFRSKSGLYLPPYAHRSEINAGWFQDYGGDVKQLDSSFAYVDGTFQAELPAGEVYVEMMKGFEYEPVRRKLDIRPGQTELDLELKRPIDLRSKGWVTADTHVHFLSPNTAILEGQAEGVNLINLLAAQWGDLFTNIGDIPHGGLSSKDGENLVWIGTENRSHFLGHIGLLGNNSNPVLPLVGSSPNGTDECYFGDALWSSMADWADACREREGLSVAVHFPFPTAEIAADIVLGKIDAVELMPHDNFNHLTYFDYYRYLNCGYRMPAVGGTDKMGASTAVGKSRTYAYLGNQPFTFANWSKAVRNGNTFVTSGPLLFLKVDGHEPGGEITLSPGGGTVEVEVKASGTLPIRIIELVHNGRVVATARDAGGPRELTLREKVHVDGPGWLLARCESKPGSDWFTRRSAHTSPVYFKMPGQEPFSPIAATYFLNLINGTHAWAEHLATRPDAQRLARVLKVLTDARELLHRKMHAHGMKV